MAHLLILGLLQLSEEIQRNRADYLRIKQQDINTMALPQNAAVWEDHVQIELFPKKYNWTRMISHMSDMKTVYKYYSSPKNTIELGRLVICVQIL